MRSRQEILNSAEASVVLKDNKALEVWGPGLSDLSSDDQVLDEFISSERSDIVVVHLGGVVEGEAPATRLSHVEKSEIGIGTEMALEILYNAIFSCRSEI